MTDDMGSYVECKPQENKTPDKKSRRRWGKNIKICFKIMCTGMQFALYFCSVNKMIGNYKLVNECYLALETHLCFHIVSELFLSI